MPIERIVIASSGAAGWMTASALARRLPMGRVSIVVIERGGVDDSLGVPTCAEPTLASTPLYHAQLGYDEDKLLARARGSFALGRALSGWTSGIIPAFHPYGEIGGAIGALGFHHLVARLRKAGEAININNYSVAALCAQSNRFARPPEDSRSVLSTMDYALHLDVEGYRQSMKADALSRGVETCSGQVLGVSLDDAGLIHDVMTHAGQRLAGDLFVDCTGQSRDLVSRMPEATFEDWSRWFPCDRARFALHQTDQTPSLYTEINAHSGGWQRFVPLQGAEGETSLFCSALHPGEDGDHKIAAGKQAKAWSGNCIAIGGAAVVLDPVASSQLHLVQSAILRLLALFPHDRAARAEQAEYVRQTDNELACARDFALLHYTANGRRGDEYWDACCAAEMPETLAYRLALYQSCGRVVLHDGEIFDASDWVALFDAMGVRPARHDVLADALPQGEVHAHFARLRDVMLKAVATVPPHAESLARYCSMDLQS